MEDGPYITDGSESYLLDNAISTVNPEIFARILFSRKALTDIFATVKIATNACFTFISRRQSDFTVLEDFIFAKLRKCEVSRN